MYAISFSFSDFTFQSIRLEVTFTSMELEKVSNGNYHHDAAGTVDKGFVFACLLYVDIIN